jgi:hypothetical protein
MEVLSFRGVLIKRKNNFAIFPEAAVKTLIFYQKVITCANLLHGWYKRVMIMKRNHGDFV